MELNGTYKEVFFDQYCKACQHSKLAETEMPCEECLDEPVNQSSHKPVRWVEKTDAK